MSAINRFCSLIPGFGVKLSAIILAGPTVLFAVGACPPHDGVRRRWWINEPQHALSYAPLPEARPETPKAPGINSRIFVPDMAFAQHSSRNPFHAGRTQQTISRTRWRRVTQFRRRQRRAFALALRT